MTTRGLVLGKFMPPHLGHVRLFEFALRLVDNLDIVACTKPGEPIDGDQREDWVRALAPHARVVRLHKDLPDTPDQHEHFWELWRSHLLRVLGAAPSHVFAGEAYGARLAAELGATYVPLDRADGSFQISATEIRSDPALHWRRIPLVVRPTFQQLVHIVGPESTGKTTLTRALADAFDASWVPEYARTWLMRDGAPRKPPEESAVSEADLLAIARGHAASVDSMRVLAERPLAFSDTDALCTAIWSKEFLGRVPEAVLALEDAEAPAFTLLTDVDLPWVDDAIRYRPDEGKRLFECFVRRLTQANRPFAVVRGRGTERTAAAIRAVTRALDTRNRGPATDGSS